jgi:hypothetical protein
MSEIEVKLELLRMSERIVTSCPHRSSENDSSRLKEIYRQLVALFNEKL